MTHDHEKFEIARLEQLNDESRFETLDPDILWDALAMDDPAITVEIGAGTGLFASRFAAMVPGSIVYAVDMEPAMVRWMSDNRPEVAAGALIPVLSTETAIPLSDESADAVYMLNLHHELAEPEATYSEAFRLLRRGGRVLVADWTPEADQDRPPRHLRATPEQLAAALSAAGFQEVAIDHRLPSHSLVTATRT